MPHDLILVFDLDDTLYPEVSYKLSALGALAPELARDFGLEAAACDAFFRETIARKGSLHPRLFDDFCARFALPAEQVPGLVARFRAAPFAIAVYPDFAGVADRLPVPRRSRLLLTDGDAAVQMRKIAALGLERWFDADLMLLSSRLGEGVDKTREAPFRHAEGLFRERTAARFVSLGDNPRKDFAVPRQRGWITIRLNRGPYRNQEMERHQDCRIESYAELPGLLAALG